MRREARARGVALAGRARGRPSPACRPRAREAQGAPRRAPASTPDRPARRRALPGGAAGPGHAQASSARQAAAPEWEKVVLRYRRVVARYPQSGVLRQRAARRRRPLPRDGAALLAAGYEDDAVAGLPAPGGRVPEQPPGREGALHRRSRSRAARGDRKRDRRGAREAYLDAFPDARAGEGRQGALMKKGAAAPQEASLPTPPPPGLAQVFNLRFWSGASSTRVVLDVEKAVRYSYDRIADPDRLWVDLEGTRLHPNLRRPHLPRGRRPAGEDPHRRRTRTTSCAWSSTSRT